MFYHSDRTRNSVLPMYAPMQCQNIFILDNIPRCLIVLEKNCKVVLIACNTASASAFQEVKSHVGNKAIVIDVINPVVDYYVWNGDEPGDFNNQLTYIRGDKIKPAPTITDPW